MSSSAIQIDNPLTREYDDTAFQFKVHVVAGNVWAVSEFRQRLRNLDRRLKDAKLE